VPLDIDHANSLSSCRDQMHDRHAIWITDRAKRFGKVFGTDRIDRFRPESDTAGNVGVTFAGHLSKL
jgi:hypothetical protein